MCGFGRLLTFSDPASVALYGISRGAFVSEQERLDEEFARWSNWLSDPIYEDTIDLMAARQLFSEYGEVVEHAPDDVRQLTGPPADVGFWKLHREARFGDPSSIRGISIGSLHSDAPRPDSEEPSCTVQREVHGDGWHRRRSAPRRGRELLQSVRHPHS